MLKGLRFQKRLRMLPGVRANLSKSGVSASFGPKGANVNLGRDGITTNAGIPGTGLSYRQKLKPKNGNAWIGVAALLVGLAFAGWQNRDTIADWITPAAPPVVAGTTAPAPPEAAPAPAASDTVGTAGPARKAPTIAAQRGALLKPGGTIYIRRAGSVLRQAPKPSAKALKKLDKGAAVTVVALDDDWTQVRDGDITGWMRTSVLGPKP